MGSIEACDQLVHARHILHFWKNPYCGGLAPVWAHYYFALAFVFIGHAKCGYGLQKSLRKTLRGLEG